MSRRDIGLTCAKKIAKLSKISWDCSISLKFCTDFDHVTLGNGVIYEVSYY